MNSTQDFDDVPTWLRSVHGIILSLLLVASIAGNSFVLALVACNKRLQYRSVLISIGLVIADLLIATAWSAQGIANITAGSCPFGDAGCSTLGALTTLGSSARWCIIALVTLERFCRILCPLCHHWGKWSKALLIILSILCWIVPIATMIPWLAGVGRYRFRLEYSSCTIFCDDDRGCYQFYIVLYGFYVSIGGILPMVLYFMLCMIGHRNAYKMKHITLGTFSRRVPAPAASAAAIEEGRTTAAAVATVEEGNTTTAAAERGGHDTQESDDATSRPECSATKDNTTHNSPTTSTSSKPDTPSPSSPPFSSPSSPSSSSSSSGSPIEKKILATFFMIFINVFVTQLPIYITSILRSSQEIYEDIPLVLHFIFIDIYLLGSVLDPVLIMRNRDFWDVIKNGLRKRQAQNSQRNSVTHTLLEFAKISSLFDMQQQGGATIGTGNMSRANMRRNSCPSTTQNMVFVQKISKANSFDGCVSFAKEGSEGPRAVATGGHVATIRFDREGIQVHGGGGGGGGGVQKEKEQLNKQKTARDGCNNSSKPVGTLACVDER